MSMVSLLWDTFIFLYFFLVFFMMHYSLLLLLNQRLVCLVVMKVLANTTMTSEDSLMNNRWIVNNCLFHFCRQTKASKWIFLKEQCFCYFLTWHYLFCCFQLTISSFLTYLLPVNNGSQISHVTKILRR